MYIFAVCVNGLYVVMSRKRDVISMYSLSNSHHNDVIKGVMACQITSLTIVYSIVYSGADQRKHQSSASLALVRGIHRWPMNSPHKGPVTRKMLPFDDVIVITMHESIIAFNEIPFVYADAQQNNIMHISAYIMSQACVEEISSH